MADTSKLAAKRVDVRWRSTQPNTAMPEGAVKRWQPAPTRTTIMPSVNRAGSVDRGKKQGHPSNQRRRVPRAPSSGPGLLTSN